MPTSRRFSARLAGALLLALALAPVHAVAGTRDLALRFKPSPDSDVARYRAYVGQAPGVYDVVVEIASYTLASDGVATAVLRGTNDAVRLYITLTAVDAAGQESLRSNELPVAPVPPPPTLPPGPATRRAELRWQPSPDADVVGYRIYLGASSRTYDTTVPVQSFALQAGVAVAVLSGFAESARFAALSAIDAAGNESVYSNELTLGATCDPTACSDANVCTVDACGSNGCTHTPAPNGTLCDDGNPGTSGDTCQAGTCSGTALPPPPPPPPACQPGDCDDANACTLDACGASGCTHVSAPDGTPCDDGISATEDDTCRAGACAGSAPLPPGRRAAVRWQPSPDTDVERYKIYLGPSSGRYDLIVPVESFDLEAGIATAVLSGLGDAEQFVALSAVDAAGNESVLSNELHIGAACTAAACADANPCTVDSCGPQGCSHSPAPDGTTCDDGDAGTLGDVCRAGTCAGEIPQPVCQPADCDDANACTLDACGASGCTHVTAPDGTSCDDGDPGTAGDTCRAGACAGSAPLPDGRQVAIRWQASTEPDVTRYQIYLGPTSGSYDLIVPVESFDLAAGVAVAVLSGLDAAEHFVP